MIADYSIEKSTGFKLHIVGLILVLIVCVAGSVAADSDTIDPLARDILKKMGNHLAAANEFAFKAEVTSDEVEIGVQKIHTTDNVEAVVRRPNKLWIDTHGDLFNKRFWYDGSTVALMSLVENFYATTKTRSKIDTALDDLMDRYGITTPVADFLFRNPYDVLIENVTAGSYAGIHTVDGIACHHLAFMQENLDWQIWIEEGKHVVPRKFVVTYKNEPGSPETSTIFKEWDFSTKHPDHLFEFKAPVSARKIEFLPLTEM